MKSLCRWSGWIFDLDGTLTVPVHDFAMIRRELEVPDGLDILGHLAGLASNDAQRQRARLDEIERELAAQAQAAPGVAELLEVLQGLGVQMGIVTRNSREVALVTLEAIGVRHCFAHDHVLGRDEVRPKPDPAGIVHLLEGWGLRGDDAVMVGDYLFDLQAGRAAGTATIHVGRPDGQRWPEVSDLMVADLGQLAALLRSSAQGVMPAPTDPRLPF